jgi:hypothetical protein
MACLDENLIYSANLKEFREDVRTVMASVKKACFYRKAPKCEFHMIEVKHLISIFRVNGIKIDPEQAQAVENRETLEKLKEVQAYPGFTNFY